MTLVPPRQRVDRDEVFLEQTKSICPVCKAVIDAEVNIRDKKVFLRKRCREHGEFEALLYVPNAAELVELLVPTRHGSRTVGDPDASAMPGEVQVNLGRALR